MEIVGQGGRFRGFGAFSAVAAALVFVFLILSFIFSFITPTLGPHAEKLKTERIRFHETRIGYSPQYVPGGKQVIEAFVPRMSLTGYCTDLRSMTGGRGEFEYKFDRYEQAPSDIQEAQVKERADKVAEGNVEA